MTTQQNPKKYNTNATEKTLAVIDYIFETEASFTEIQQALNIPKATLHRILSALENEDYVAKNTLTEKYSLGNKFIHYGETTKAKRTLNSIAEPFIKQLAEITGESACLSVYYQGVSIALVSFEGDSSALTSKLIPFSPLNCSASGKIFLSLMDEADMTHFFQSDACIDRTVNTFTDAIKFKEERENILKNNISIDDEEYEYGLYCISVPLTSHEESLYASVGITGPKARIMMKGLDNMIREVRNCSEEISRILEKIKYQFEF